MSNRNRIVLNLALSLALLSFAGGVNIAIAGQEESHTGAAAATEDVLHMSDGRVLRGKILSETAKDLVFEYHNPQLNVKTKLTYDKEKILKIERGIAVAAAPSTSSKPVPSIAKPATEVNAARQVYRSTDASLPGFYVVPMKGQMGTDVRSEVYDDVIKEIKQVKPAYIIIEVQSSDTSELMHQGGYQGPTGIEEWGELDFENYRDLVAKFRDGLRDIPQIVWMHDSDGVSATVAMAWDKIYMSPGGRFGAKVSMLDRSGAKNWQDPDVRAKMIAAWLRIAQSFLEKGGYPPALAEAMLDSEPKLSGSWKGREVLWRLDDAGDYVVDTSDKRAAYFTSKTAEDFCITKGTAESLDDLALLLGLREYRVIDSKASVGVEGYIQDWRRTLAQCLEARTDFNQHMGWASGQDMLKWLGRAKQDLDRILRGMDQYKAVELRLESDHGVTRLEVVTTIEQLNEQIRALKARDAATGGGGRSGPGSGRGG